MDAELEIVKAHETIYGLLVKYVLELSKRFRESYSYRRFCIVVTYLDYNLLRNAATLEEYFNTETLESRVELVIKSKIDLPYMNWGIAPVASRHALNEAGLMDAALDMVKAHGAIYSFLVNYALEQNKTLKKPFTNKKICNAVMVLDAGLLRVAETMEEYFNTETLESRVELVLARNRVHLFHQNHVQRAKESVHDQPYLQNADAPPASGSSRQVANRAGLQSLEHKSTADWMKAHNLMHDFLLKYLLQKGKRCKEIFSYEYICEFVRRMDAHLFRDATTLEEYINPETLESRMWRASRMRRVGGRAGHQNYLQCDSKPVRYHPYLQRAISPSAVGISRPEAIQDGNQFCEIDSKPELVKACETMQDKEEKYLLGKGKSSLMASDEGLHDIVGLLEQLFLDTSTMEQYMDAET